MRKSLALTVVCICGFTLLYMPVYAIEQSPTQGLVFLMDPTSAAMRAGHLTLDSLQSHSTLFAAGWVSSFTDMELKPLDNQHRRQSHIILEQVPASGIRPTAAAWTAAIVTAAEALQASRVNSRLILIFTDYLPIDEDWTPVSAVVEQTDVEIGLVSSILPEEVPSWLTASWQVAQAGDLLHSLASWQGLSHQLYEELCQHGPECQLVLQLDRGIDKLLLIVEGETAGSTYLVSPQANLYGFPEAASSFELYVASDYAVFHLTSRQFSPAEWEGPWRVKADGVAHVSVWQSASNEAAAWITSGGHPLLQVQLNNLVTGPDIQAISPRNGAPLLSLNDRGLNGDSEGGDGIYSSLLLPHQLAQLASESSLRLVIGERQQIVPLQTVSGEPVAQQPFIDATAVWPLWPCLGGLLVGCVLWAIEKPIRYRLVHDSHDGQSTTYLLGRTQCFAIINGRIALVRRRKTSTPDLRVSSKGGKAELEVLSEKEVVLVNDERVFLCRSLQHRDEISVGGERFELQDITLMRVGKKRSLGRR